MCDHNACKFYAWSQRRRYAAQSRSTRTTNGIIINNNIAIVINGHNNNNIIKVCAREPTRDEQVLYHSYSRLQHSYTFLRIYTLRTARTFNFIERESHYMTFPSTQTEPNRNHVCKPLDFLTHLCRNVWLSPTLEHLKNYDRVGKIQIVYKQQWLCWVEKKNKIELQCIINTIVINYQQFSFGCVCKLNWMRGEKEERSSKWSKPNYAHIIS